MDYIKQALKEDIGKGDITSVLFIPVAQSLKADLVVKEDCVVCGLEIAQRVLQAKDKKIRFTPHAKDGDFIRKGRTIANIQGKARTILAVERVVLNYICLLSGIATKTRQYVQAIKPYKAKVMDTRKTIPGIRELEKYAVRIGGGVSHRLRLDEMILVKDNHLEAVGGFRGVDKVLRQQPAARKYKIELEVNSLKEFRQAMMLNPDVIMLDNMRIDDMRKAVLLRNRFSLSKADPRPKLEASGGINLNNIRRVASCGVEMISVGSLTHSVDSVDMSLEFK